MRKYNYNHDELCSNLARIMKEKKITARYIARKLHITESAFSKYKNGSRDISIGMLFELANILKVDVLTLVFGNDAILYLNSDIKDEQLLSDIRALQECQNDLFKHYHRLYNVAEHWLEFLKKNSGNQAD